MMTGFHVGYCAVVISRACFAAMLCVAQLNSDCETMFLAACCPKAVARCATMVSMLSYFMHAHCWNTNPQEVNALALQVA